MQNFFCFKAEHSGFLPYRLELKFTDCIPQKKVRYEECEVPIIVITLRSTLTSNSSICYGSIRGSNR